VLSSSSAPFTGLGASFAPPWSTAAAPPGTVFTTVPSASSGRLGRSNFQCPSWTLSRLTSAVTSAAVSARS
jgi:hypothetical protein